MSRYAPLASHSTADLPLYTDSRSPPSPPRLVEPRPAAGDTQALLSTEQGDTTDDDDALLLEKESKHPSSSSLSSSSSLFSSSSFWPGPLSDTQVRLRTILLSALSVAVLVSLFVFFHPSSNRLSPSVSRDAASYYSGAPLAIGLFDPALGHLAENPLESDATFADVPFAKVGQSWDGHGRTPEWAGGDGGSAAVLETQSGGTEPARGKRFWNGTHWFDKTVVLVTIDGMRPEYVSSTLTPNLLELANKGLRAEYLEPVFPALSAPNHWSILTGLYPSSHGIVSNRFRSSATSKLFDFEAEPTIGNTWAPEWYKGEPIYETALRSSLRVATLMHPLVPPVLSSSSSSSKPTYWYAPVARTHPRKKLAKVLSFLDLATHKRPHLVVTHFDEIATQARKGGTDANGHGVAKGLEMVDETFFGALQDALEARGLAEWVEIVVVGDTGLGDVDKDRVVVLDDVIERDVLDKLERPFEGGASTVVGMRLDPASDEFAATVERIRTAANGGRSGFDVYLGDELAVRSLLPVKDDRVAPLWLVAKEGWTLTTRDELEVLGGKIGFKATNGYDPSTSASMKSVFFAKGPYTTTLDRGRGVVKGFSNLEVYDFVANALDIPLEARAMNNGTKGFWRGGVGASDSGSG